MKRWSWTVLALGLLGCSETVSTLDIQLRLPPGFDKGFKCADDPRWSRYISIKASCDEGRVQSSFELQKGARLTLLNIPLGECTVEVETTNVHGRVVLSGEADVTLVEGKDETLQIQLLVEPCREPSCDSDKDGLYFTDEKGLKTSPKTPDTDGDGLYDGVEVAFCCSDPLKKNKAGECSLRIQHVKPTIGVVGTLVKITATDALKSPKVTLGEVPLANPLTDANQVHGAVGKGAVLGDVTLSSAGVTSAPSELMFTTLERDLTSLVELQVKAGTTSGLMHEVVDMAHYGKLLIMLGKATASWSTKNPMLLIVDRAANKHYRYTMSAAGLPVAIAANAKRLAVLLQDAKGSGQLVVLEQPTLGQLKVTRTVSLQPKHPVDVGLDLKGDAVVLFRSHLGTVPLGQGPSGGSQPVYRAVQGVSKPGGKTHTVLPTCTGMSLHFPPGGPNTWTAFLACNMPTVFCPRNNKKCQPRATLVRVTPVHKCVALKDGVKAPAGCWVHHQSVGTATGAPAVSAKNKMVYLLTNKGIGGAPMTYGGAPKTKVLIPKIQLGWPAMPGVTGVMAADTKGRLYTVPALQNRRRMLLTEPEHKDLARRYGRPFEVGLGGEEALTLALHPDGSVLDVIRRAYDGSQGLTTVCLKRCSTCICR